MKRSSKITIAVVMAVGIVGTSAAIAGKRHFNNHENKAKFAVSMISDRLDLDPTQEQALVALKDQVLVAKDSMQGQFENTRDDVKSMITAETMDSAQALEMITAKTAAINEVAPELVLALANFMNSLDAEQKQEILDAMESHHGRRGHGKWRH